MSHQPPDIENKNSYVFKIAMDYQVGFRAFQKLEKGDNLRSITFKLPISEPLTRERINMLVDQLIEELNMPVIY